MATFGGDIGRGAWWEDFRRRQIVRGGRGGGRGGAGVTGVVVLRV